MNKKGWLTLLGFLLFLFGMYTLVLSLVSVKLSFLAWIDAFGPLPGFLIKVLMIIAGIVVTVVARSNFAGEGPIFETEPESGDQP